MANWPFVPSGTGQKPPPHTDWHAYLVLYRICIYVCKLLLYRIETCMHLHSWPFDWFIWWRGEPTKRLLDEFLVAFFMLLHRFTTKVEGSYTDVSPVVEVISLSSTSSFQAQNSFMWNWHVSQEGWQDPPPRSPLNPRVAKRSLPCASRDKSSFMITFHSFSFLPDWLLLDREGEERDFFFFLLSFFVWGWLSERPL